MPEKPEVITVAKKLEKKILGKKIIDVNILYQLIVLLLGENGLL